MNRSRIATAAMSKTARLGFTLVLILTIVSASLFLFSVSHRAFAEGNESVTEATPTPEPTITPEVTPEPTATPEETEEPEMTPEVTPEVTPEPTATSNASATPEVTPTPSQTEASSEPAFRVGPVVTLRPLTSEINSSSDGLVELFISNPSLNEIELNGDMYISLPSGIHIYGQGFGLATAAGTTYGQFNVQPGTAKTFYVNIKADQTAVGQTYYVHFSGLYWPDDNVDAYQPLSLTHPFTVTAASPNPLDPAATSGSQLTQPESTPQVAGLWIGWWIVIGLAAVCGITLIILALRRG